MIFPVQRKKLWGCGLVTVVVVGLIVGVYFLSRDTHSRESSARHVAAVVTNGLECSEIGRDILRENGTAADAAVAALFCEGVTCPQSAGIGGGLVLTYFDKASGKVETIVGREVAPAAAHEDMFVNWTAINGAKAIAVPGELKAYWELHQKYGKLPWARLVQPTIDLCRKGHVVSVYLSRILNRRRNSIFSSPTLAEIYVDPKTKDVYQEGDLVKRLKLAETLEVIAKEGADTLYNNGTIAQKLVAEIKQLGGIVTIEDLMNYRTRWEAPNVAKLPNNNTLYSITAPASGPLIAFITNIMRGFAPEDINTVVSQGRIAEAFKYAYAERTELADPKFVDDVNGLIANLTNPDFAENIRLRIRDNETSQDWRHYGAEFDLTRDSGTAHLNVLAPNGDAVSVTSSVNTLFGSKIHSTSTGIILNDSMDDFSTPGSRNAYGLPASKANFIKPSKMPLSSMCPTIILDGNNDVKLLIGGAGGSKITSSVAYVILRNLFFNESLYDAVHAPRIHHQLIPMELEYEEGMKPELVEGLRKIGHKMREAPNDSGFASMTAIGREGDKLVAVYDPRRRGSAEVY